MYKFNKIEKLLKSAIIPIKKKELIHINQALGRFLAEDVYSRIDIPPENNSAVDGFLFKNKVLKTNIYKKFKVDSELNAGEKLKDVSLYKNIVKISTGAHIPKGFDVVIMEEDFVINEKIIYLKKKNILKWMNIRKKGEDIKKKSESIF